MLTLANVLETLMIVSFGISWPINISKAWKSRSTKGISMLFYFLILSGYFFAIAGKLALIAYHAPAPWYETVRWYVMFFYVLNTLMVAAGVAIYFRNREIEKRESCEDMSAGEAAPAPARRDLRHRERDRTGSWPPTT